MKINNVDFLDSWVQSFNSAEEFANSPKTEHLFRELKSEEARKKQLEAIWYYLNQKQMPNDSRKDDGKPIGDRVTTDPNTDIGKVKTRVSHSATPANAKRPGLKKRKHSL